MKKIVFALVFLIVVAAAAALFRAPSGEGVSQPVSGLPWQIEILPDGSSKVFGLTLGSSTIGEARERFGGDMEIALVAASGESGSVEAYYGKVTAGVVTGRMILSATLDRDALDGMRRRATRNEYMESGTRKFELSPDDLALVYAAPIAAITFIPSANLDAKIAFSLFGAPGGRIRVSEQVEHLLYPDKGLALTLDDSGKEVLQYVAPRQFSRLRDSLASKNASPAK